MQSKELSPKSRTILAAIAQGHSYDQILAGELDLSREFCGPGFILHNHDPDSPGRLRGGLAGFSSAPFASLCQTTQTNPTVAS
jgi:hypothetical protein